MSRKIEKGDLVACYMTNTDVYEKLLNWGIVLDINESLKDLYVLDNNGNFRWWNHKRWRLLKKNK